MKKEEHSYTAFLFPLYPTPEQEAILWQWVGAGRWVYNRCREVNTAQYEKDKTFIFARTPKTGLSPLLTHQWSKEYPWLKEPPNGILRERINDFGKALSKVKKGGKPCFPKWRSKDIEHHQTMRFDRSQVNVKVCKRGISVSKMPGRIRWTQHRPLEGEAKAFTIKRENNRWMVSVLCKIPVPPSIPPAKEEDIGGIDVGLKCYAAASDGTIIETPRFYRQKEKRLARAQRTLSRKKKGSSNRRRARQQVNRLHCSIKRRRKDFAHKQSHAITKRTRYVGVEDLNIQGMVRGKTRLAKSFHDQGLRFFLSCLDYKARREGGEAIKAGRLFASTQLCSGCGWKQKMPLHKREYDCPKCGLHLDRDHNAAVNLRTEAVKELRTRGQWELQRRPLRTDTPVGLRTGKLLVVAGHSHQAEGAYESLPHFPCKNKDL